MLPRLLVLVALLIALIACTGYALDEQQPEIDGQDGNEAPLRVLRLMDPENTAEDQMPLMYKRWATQVRFGKRAANSWASSVRFG
ncbi:unnamed protein product, partial [Mesorhabditis spiculigera]